MPKLYRIIQLTLALALLTGCASMGAPGGADDDARDGLAIRVENTLIPSTSLTVWIVSQTGFRTMLGSVSPNDTAILRVDRAGNVGQHRLIAETTGGQELASRSFYLTRSSSLVHWSLDTNTVTVSNDD